MAHKIALNSGLEIFEIEFKDRGEKAEFAFNPSDPDLSKRLFEAQKIIDERTKEVKQFETDENGMPVADSCMEYLNSINQVVYDAIDYAFGNKISNVVFKYCSPFAVVNGEYYIWNFINGITPVLQDIIGKDRKKASDNMNKHLAKYAKKK